MFFNVNNQNINESSNSSILNLVDPADFIINTWSNFLAFSEHLQINSKDNEIMGVGFTHNKKVEDNVHIGYHLFQINDRLFAVTGETIEKNVASQDQELFFHKVCELRKNLLDSINFKKKNRENNSYFTLLDSGIPVDIKGYAYEDSDKLLITRAGKGNIELFINASVSGYNYHLCLTIHENIHSVAKTIAREKLLDERIRNLKSNK